MGDTSRESRGHQTREGKPLLFSRLVIIINLKFRILYIGHVAISQLHVARDQSQGNIMSPVYNCNKRSVTPA